jgi:hypothetical protein
MRNFRQKRGRSPGNTATPTIAAFANCVTLDVATVAEQKGKQNYFPSFSNQRLPVADPESTESPNSRKKLQTCSQPWRWRITRSGSTMSHRMRQRLSGCSQPGDKGPLPFASDSLGQFNKKFGAEARPALFV